MNTATPKKEALDLGVKGPRKLLQADLKRADYARPDYRVILKDINTTRDDVLRPEYWANCAPTLGNATHSFAMIEVIWADASRYMKLIVLAAGRNFVKVAVLEDKELTEGTTDQAVADAIADAEENAEFKVEYKGSVAKWCVIRQSDKEKITEGYATKEEANKYLDDYLRALKA